MLLKAFSSARFNCTASWTIPLQSSLLFRQNRGIATSCKSSAVMPDERDYNAAITALNTLQSNFAIVDAIRKSGRSLNKSAIPEMQEWCRRIGYEPSDLNRLNLIHIAGTKGKGSTSAFISSILSQYIREHPSPSDSSKSPRLHKVGLFTSPHLRSVRERIQINNEPLSEALFARYFFEVWDRLDESASKLGPPSFAMPPEPAAGDAAKTGASVPPPSASATKPVYFRYLTLMAFHVYMNEGVDTAVIECGIGGEYDSTNILVAPTVAAVTSLAIDHTAMLGETIEEIAWHKAGVFKPALVSRTAYTVDSQPPTAMNVLHQRAQDVGVELRAIPRRPDIDSGDVTLGLAADFQKINASLAVAVAAAHLRVLGIDSFVDDPSSPLPLPFRRGLEQVQWGGRCEVRRQGSVTWHLDGGHTIESIRLAAAWFAGCITSSSSGDVSSKPQKRVLLFNQQTRDAAALARALHATLADTLPAARPGAPLFDLALFSTNITFAAPAEGAGVTSASGSYKPDLISMNTSASDVEKLTVQRGLAEMWGALDEKCEVAVEGTIEEAVSAVRGLADALDGGEVAVLVTGSLHLVGGVLEVLESR